MITVRRYQDNDLESVNKILKEAFNVEKKNFKLDNYYEFVVLYDDVVAGYLLLTKIYNPIKDSYYMHVDYVCVSSKYRGLGLGRKMLDYAYNFSLECECLYLELTCSRFREAAHKLYENAGFIKRDSDIYRKDVI